MLRNYFKIAWRNLTKNAVFSLINIIGLTIGMTACFLIALYVNFESSYDAFNTKADRTYRLVTDIINPSETINTNTTAWAYAPNLKNDFPEVETTVRVYGGSFLVIKDEVKFQEEKTLFADSTLFKIFDFKMVNGNPNTALAEPYSIVFTKTGAKKYFGDKDPVGQSLIFSGDMHPAKVTGVIEDIPENSMVRTDMLVSMSTLTEDVFKGVESQWGNFDPITYLLLKEGTDYKSFEKKLPGFILHHNSAEMKELMVDYKLMLQPLKSVYIHSNRQGEKGAAENIYTFSIVALFILIIACINFINLSTARSVERAKEVGIRKVVGALRGQLNRQFMAESVLPCLIAFVLTVALSALLIPSFNQLAGKTISAGILENPCYLLILFGGSLVIGLLAGVYPALVLSSFQPVPVLKGRFTSGTRGIFLRKGLVVTQFTISIVLIISTIIVYNQMSFMRGYDLGFTKDQVLVVKTEGDKARHSFKESLVGIPGVKIAAASGAVPGARYEEAYSKIENKVGEMQITGLPLYFVEFDFIEVYKLKMAAGRPFSRKFMTDTTQAMVINEAAVRHLGYHSAEEAIGKKFDQWERQGQIIGVVKDFHFKSLQESVKPLTMRIEPFASTMVSIQIDGSNGQATLKAVEAKWKEILPQRPFNYFFADEYYDRQYRSEDQFGKLFLNFSVLAILISCLGLLGLASYSTLQRTKEIGVRKVLGASVTTIVTLLSRDFVKLVLVAFIIAAPLSWYLMYKWLENFAYQTKIYWWIFALAGAVAFLIAVVTISYQAIKAAISNPVKSLRTE